jgi:hypothetical protein
MRKNLLPLSLLFCCFSAPSLAQSTYGSIVGTVKDTSGASVSNADVKVTNTQQNEVREIHTNRSGDYDAPNLLPGRYAVQILTPGFEVFNATNVILEARQTIRVDATLQVGSTQQTVEVNDAEAGVIPTETQTIQETFTPQQLLDLPANIRANGNTSPYQLLQVLPGVQSDNSGNFSVQGSIPSMTQYSVDGVSTEDVTGNSPLTSAFPSSESIAEIKVQGVGGNAEYGQPGDITTISKSGTNQFHGDLFWYAQNSALNALNFGEQTKPRMVANDFGVTAGGPVVIPHLYNGKDKTFFFGTYEGFRLPQAVTIQNEVPTALMRSGDFSQEGVTIVNPSTGAPFPNGVIPASQISSVSLGFLKLFPLPNIAPLNVSHAANYIVNRNDNYSSDQYDLRIDQYINGKQSAFVRWTSKNVNQLSPQQLLVPTESTPENVKLLTIAHNYAILPVLYNEARFGFTLDDRSQSLPFNGATFTNSLGLQGIGPRFPFNGLPEVDFSGNFTSLQTDRGNSVTNADTWEFTDNLTWNRGRHTFKYGIDFRRIHAITPLGFLGGDNYGQYSFDSTFTSSPLYPGSGSPIADFLLGLPTTTAVDNVEHDNYGLTSHWAAFAQDSFKVSRSLTIDYGVRFEYHPGYTDKYGDIGNFDPSVPKSGAVIYPNGAASLLAPEFLQSFDACPAPPVNGAPCTPVLSASQAHLPNSLRTAPKRFMPRFGFAWRPFGGDKTVIRGGFDVYDITVLGSIYYALTGTLQSNTRTYNNVSASGQPIFAFPQTQIGGLGEIAPYGTAYFGTANEIHFKDPYTMQWNFSMDRDLGFQTGLRLSYIGSGTRDLVWSPNLNQSYYSTIPYPDQPLSTRPFPNWGVVNSRVNGANQNYESFQAEVNHRYKSGLTLNAAYTLAHDLADNQGPNPSGFAGENSGGRTMDLYDLKAEYGNVYGVRRNRFIVSGVYDLPFGRGRQFASNANHFVDALFGGWQLSSIFLVQSGPFETPYFSGGDPSGTGSGIIGRPQFPDRVASGNLPNPNRNDWFNLNAYVCPGTPGWVPGTPCTIGDGGPGDLLPIGRFGNSGIGTFVGPGTVNLNAGLGKYFSITERLRIKVEGSFTNVLNHTNLNDPILSIDSPSAGQITSARPADFGGARTGQVGARIEF